LNGNNADIRGSTEISWCGWTSAARIVRVYWLVTSRTW